MASLSTCHLELVVLHLHLHIMSICKARDKPFIVCPYFNPVLSILFFKMLIDCADIISLDKDIPYIQHPFTEKSASA